MFWQPQFNKQFRQNIGTYLWSGKNIYPQHDVDSDTSNEQHQPQVQNLKDNLSVAYTDLEGRTFLNNCFETINIKLNLGLNHELQQSKNLHLQQLQKLEENKLCLQRADRLASKFTAALEMKSFVQPPASYQKDSEIMMTIYQIQKMKKTFSLLTHVNVQANQFLTTKVRIRTHDLMERAQNHLKVQICHLTKMQEELTYKIQILKVKMKFSFPLRNSEKMTNKIKLSL